MTRTHHVLVVMTLLSAATLALMLTFRFDCDDAYIFARYADNAVAGHGLVYNPGQRVEGFTSPLWMLLLVAGAAAGLPVMGWASVLGLACAIGMLWLLLYMPRAWGEPLSPLCLPAPLLAATHVGLTAYAGSGMETPLYVLLTTAAVFRFALEREQPRRAPWSALLLAAACWTRPEALPLLLTLAILRIASRPAGEPPRRLLVWVLIAFLPVLALPALRWLYYGELLPNTYYAKSLPLGATLRQGAAYGLEWLRGMGWWTPLVLVLTAWLWGVLPRGVRALTMATLALLVTPFLLPGDWMPHGRFFLPAVPLLAMLWQECGRALRRHAPDPMFWRTTLALLLLLGAVQAAQWTQASVRQPVTDHHEAVQRWRAVGQALARHVAPDDLVVLGAAGVMGRALPCRVVDYYGLLEPTIARAPTQDLAHLVPGHVRSHAAHVLALEPRFIVPATQPRDTPAHDLEAMRDQFWSRAHLDLYAHPDLALHYRPFNLPLDGGYVAVLKRNGFD